MDWISVSVGAVGGIASLLAQRALAAVDGVEKSIIQAGKDIAVLQSHCDDARASLDTLAQRITGCELETAALKERHRLEDMT